MANEFPTSPEVLAEASPWSLSDLALMSPEEMSPSAELAYIEELRAYRERYERALGAKAPRAKPGGAKPSASKVVTAILNTASDSDDEVSF